MPGERHAPGEGTAMFLLRCAFWLSVVYAAMFSGLPWQSAPRGPALAMAARGLDVGPPARAAVGQVLAGQGLAGRALVGEGLVGQALAGAATLCADRGGQCLRDAAGLTALVETAIAAAPDDSGTWEAAAGASGGVAAPMPVPDPRRRGRLTRQP